MKKYIDDAILNGAKYIVFKPIESEIESQHSDVFFIKTKNESKELTSGKKWDKLIKESDDAYLI